ncbi:MULTISPECIES: hypothetical protein [Rhizobium]|uniref:hypothetical protein n=1 Tax=Rhizobium TaxID=379 RepID=UPI0007EAC17E|nr:MULTISPECIES: hypothetical protein [Rhizobium]ANK92752.1 hypothetical protein AMK01_CH03329 [Rhizobium sp. N6212]ANK98797.1 hypothetical protein AMK00_CH03333 [Rhizobium sp. N621]ANL04925.1 hypothetical protein AMJ99_CH03409 [Rhizobium esperanzae]ANL10984.1 hypothetical protein AMJ98_CH03360 [Rhizobium sp. N1341]ANL23036.1 hypothetical protein AMJ96_CH03360 [Rhizobium sp. N113]
MVLLPESFKAFQYQAGIDRICDAYRASADTINKAVSEATLACAQYLKSGADDREYDEDGILIFSTANSLAHAELEAILAVSVVREAFITSAFHYWERSARVWTGLHGFEHKFPALKEGARRLYSVSPQLPNLNRLNNVLKHNSRRVDQTLLKNRPDYFGSPPPRTNGSTLPEVRLRLTHEHVEEAFDIVRASGPTR